MLKIVFQEASGSCLLFLFSAKYLNRVNDESYQVKDDVLAFSHKVSKSFVLPTKFSYSM